MQGSRERAEQIILEILRQAGANGLGRSKVYKAFWLAHLFYARENKGFLSDWKVVKMPRGPGIHRGEQLLQDLGEKCLLVQSDERVGPFIEKRCMAARFDNQPSLPSDAVQAIEKALDFIKGMTAQQLSDLSHEFSRSWWETSFGDELDIYSDLIPDEEYQERTQTLQRAAAELEDVFK